MFVGGGFLGKERWKEEREEGGREGLMCSGRKSRKRWEGLGVDGGMVGGGRWVGSGQWAVGLSG